jgi:hypothetical protein
MAFVTVAATLYGGPAEGRFDVPLHKLLERDELPESILVDRDGKVCAYDRAGEDDRMGRGRNGGWLVLAAYRYRSRSDHPSTMTLPTTSDI